jgi:hypothetical protein
MKAAPDLTTAAGPIKGLQYRRCRVGEADYPSALAGDDEPVLLLHGFPQGSPQISPPS